jgi:hypothetical protein
MISELDVLMIVDDTPAIASRLGALRASDPRLAQALEQLAPGGLPSVRVAAVAAAAPGTGCGAGSRAHLCGVTSTDDFLATRGCGAQPNFAGSFADAFACLADFGAADCGPAQPLEAMRRALADAPSFVRPDAALEVLIVDGADDASADGGVLVPVATYVDFLRNLKPDPNSVFLSVVGPPADCSGGAMPAEAAPRLTELAQSFGSNSVYMPACRDDFVPVLGVLFSQLAVLNAPQCVDAIRDADPSRVGLQPTCAVDDITAEPDGLERRMALPSCDEAQPPCWRLAADISCPGGWSFAIDREPGWCPQQSVIDRLTCLGCADAADPACAGP